MTSVTVPSSAPTLVVRWHYLWYVAGALAVMVGAIISHDMWFLNYVHVFSGLLWTGIDLYMGFVIGPILRSVEPSVRRAMVLRLTPRTLFLFPTLSTITSTTGWYLAVQFGFDQLPWPQYGWMVAALVITTLMFILGTGYLLPNNLRVCFELRKENPDYAWVSRTTSRFYYVIATQGTMQMLIIVIMARFATGI